MKGFLRAKKFRSSSRLLVSVMSRKSIRIRSAAAFVLLFLLSASSLPRYSAIKYKIINGRIVRVLSIDSHGESERKRSGLDRWASSKNEVLWRARNSLIQQGVPPMTSPLLVTGITITVLRTLFKAREPASRAFYFWTRTGPIIVHYKFTQWWLTASKAPRERRDTVYEKLHNRYSRPSQEIILHLSGLFCKIGQVLSSRPDIIPPQYVERFALVQDAMPQWPLDKIISVIDNSLQESHGVSVQDVFEYVEETALGSASIGQAHRAVLRDTFASRYGGIKEVAVKVMHPGAEMRFAHDFQVFRWLCRLALPGWKGLLDELERQMMTEFDYHNEANCLRDIRSNILQSPYRDKVKIPFPCYTLCTKNVLVMEMLNGKKLVDHLQSEIARVFGSTEKARRMLMERRIHAFDSEPPLLNNESLITKARLLILREKCRYYLDLLLKVHGHEIFHDGAFNGDAHPGNVLVLEDGTLGLIDYGQTRRINSEERLSIARIVSCLAKNEGELVVATSMRDAGFETTYPDDTMLAKYASLFFDSDIEGKMLGFATPQLYFASLMNKNALVKIPDAAVFIARVSFLFRGLGSAIGLGAVQTSKQWGKQATEALNKHGTAHISKISR